jgi:hypothetical protein
MKITHKAANTYGYISIAIMLVLLVLVLLQAVPKAWHMPLFGIALALYLVRITLRLILARQARVDRQDRPAEKDEDTMGSDPHA